MEWKRTTYQDGNHKTAHRNDVGNIGTTTMMQCETDEHDRLCRFDLPAMECDVVDMVGISTPSLADMPHRVAPRIVARGDDGSSPSHLAYATRR